MLRDALFSAAFDEVMPLEKHHPHTEPPRYAGDASDAYHPCYTRVTHTASNLQIHDHRHSMQVQTFREFEKHYNYVDLWALARKAERGVSQGAERSSLNANISKGHIGLGSWNFFLQDAGAGFKECMGECGEHFQKARVDAHAHTAPSIDWKRHLIVCARTCRLA